MAYLYLLERWILLFIGVTMIYVELLAFVRALMGNAQKFTAHSSINKWWWLVILAFCLAFGLLFLRAPLGIVPLVAVIVAGIFLADLAPKVSNSSRLH